MSTSQGSFLFQDSCHKQLVRNEVRYLALWSEQEEGPQLSREAVTALLQRCRTAEERASWSPKENHLAVSLG